MNECAKGVQDGGEMPLDLLLDLLVDAELPERERTRVLRRLDAGMTGRGAGPGEAGDVAGWRELSLRFLARQVEKETVRQLMEGGSILPEPLLQMSSPVYKFRPARWMNRTSMMATAAGVLIAASSAVVTLYVARAKTTAPNTAMAMYTGNLPGNVLGVPENIPVSVPLVQEGQNAAANLFSTSINDIPAGARRSVVIQQDGNGNAVVIPVNTMQMRVY